MTGVCEESYPWQRYKLSFDGFQKYVIFEGSALFVSFRQHKRAKSEENLKKKSQTQRDVNNWWNPPKEGLPNNNLPINIWNDPLS